MSTASQHTVAFDIDGTWTLAPALFHHIACLFAKAGWQVIIVTGREQPEKKVDGYLFWSSWPVIVSGPLLKEEAALRAGHKVNVWIDDMPGMIQNCRILGGDLKSENAKSAGTVRK